MINQNPRVTEIFRDHTLLNLSEGSISQVSPTIVPVVDVTPDKHPLFIVNVNNSASSGSGTVLSAVAGKGYLIHGYTAGFVKDATCDTADGAIQWNIKQRGVTRYLASFPVLTLTAQSEYVSVMLPYPIKTDVGASIGLDSNTFTAGKLRRTITLYYSEYFE